MKEESVSPTHNSVERYRSALLHLVFDLIRTKSDNPPGDEVAICALLQKELAGLGFQDVSIVAERSDRPNLIVRVPGRKKGPSVLFVAHTDTKPVGDTWKQWRSDPFEPTVVDEKLYGLGATDMKGALGAMVYAAAILKDSFEFSGELILALVADEEAGGRYGADYLSVEYGLNADVAIIGEPAGISQEWESLHVGCRGVSCFNIAVFGTQMHSSLSDRLPSVNASVKLGELMSRMESRLKLTYTPHPLCPGGPTVNVGVRLRGGVNFGVYPGFAEFSCDVRTLPGMSRNQLEKDLQMFLHEAMADDPELRCELRFQPAPADWIAPTEISPENAAVVALCDAAEEVLGRRPPLTLYPAGTDAPKFQYLAGIPTVPAFGPGLISVAHGANEWVGTEAIMQACKIYLSTAMRLLQAEPSTEK